MQTGKAVMATDLVIILLSMVVFRNIESGLYGLINMVVGTYVIDVILYGMNKSTMITVITEKPKEIADELMYLFKERRSLSERRWKDRDLCSGQKAVLQGEEDRL